MGLLTDYFNKKKSDKDGSGSSDSKGGGLIAAALPNYHKGGMVRKTGPAVLKKGERVLTKAQQRKRGGK